MSDSPPEKLGKYEVREEISRGNMGAVYLGYDPYIDCRVAIKVANIQALNDPETGVRYRKMFFNEAHAAGMLNHPNIINIYDVGIDGDDWFIVMEYVEGGHTLKPYCRPDNLLPVDKVVEIIFDCAKALDYAHRQGVVHRDIKPSNILFTPDQDIKIGDFSIAQIQTEEDTAEPGDMLGSPRYMSPEQLREEQISSQTDLYSLGVVLYELLTGRPPFSADNFPALVNQVLNEEPPSLTDHRADISEALNAIAQKALSKDTAGRYQTGLEFATHLAGLFDHLEKPENDISEQQKFDAVRQLDFFKAFTDVEIWEILRASSWQNYAQDYDIIVEGDMDDCFYVIVEGEVEVIKNQVSICVLKQGECFGEIGYVEKVKRTASIKSRTQTSLLQINAAVMSQVSLNCEVRFLRVFLRTLVRRLARASEKISGNKSGLKAS